MPHQHSIIDARDQFLSSRVGMTPEECRLLIQRMITRGLIRPGPKITTQRRRKELLPRHGSDAAAVQPEGS